jgi:hypothetical protein
VENSISDLVTRLSPNDVIPLLAISLSAIVGLIAIISALIYRIHKNRLEVALKRELLDRGMSADEIAMVVSAGLSRTGCGKLKR